MDTDGSLYAAGTTWSSSLDGQASLGGYDAFLTRYNTSGTRYWTRRVGTTATDDAYGVAIDTAATTSRGIYVCGATEGAFPGFANSDGNDDLFVAKYNTAGTRQ